MIKPVANILTSFPILGSILLLFFPVRLLEFYIIYLSFTVVMCLFIICTKIDFKTKRKPRNRCGFWVFDVLDEK